MFGFDKKTAADSLAMSSAAPLLPEQWTVELDDHVLDLRWSADGLLLAAMPSVGRILLLNRAGHPVATFCQGMRAGMAASRGIPNAEPWPPLARRPLA